MASPNLTQIVATTLRNRMPDLIDNMSDNVAYFNRLRKKGNQKFEDGGRNITQPLEYAENAQFGWYSGYETMDIGVNDFITAAEFDWKQAYVPISISGLEELQNAGRSAVIKLLASKVSNARRTFINQMGSAVYGDGTAAGGRAIGGLDLIVPEVNTNTVGGINASSWSFWRNVSVDGSTLLGVAMTSANIQQAMRNVYFQLVRNNDKVDLVLADDVLYEMYMASLVAIQRIASDTEGQAGFQTVKFMGADVVLDGGKRANPGVPSSVMYMLNTDYLQFVTHSKRNMEIVGGERMSLNQDAMTQIMLWAGNMTVSNRSLQGRLDQ